VESQTKVKLALERAKGGIVLIPKCKRTDLSVYLEKAKGKIF